MFKPSRILRYSWARYRSSIGVGSNRQLKQPLNNPQVLNAINQHILEKNSSDALTIFVRITSIIFGIIIGYSSYQVIYKGTETFIPLYFSKTKRLLRSSDNIDEKLVKLTVHDQLLERLSLNETIQKEFKLPITLSESQDFEIWIEERSRSIKGLEFSPKRPYISRVDKPINIPKYSGVLEPIGGEDSFEIPVINQDERNYDVWFLGTVTLVGKSGKECTVAFKGIFDFEHINQAQLKQVHIIRTIDGKKEREVLW